MPALRQCLKHPGVYLGMLALIAGLAGADSFRPPSRQVTAHFYIALVQAYQAQVSPQLSGYVRCRFQPTCSRYSLEAVRKYGMKKGLALTADRLWRCRARTPSGTNDPVP